ncbi:hypothetical protein [Sphaerotilus sp.]|uniref:hypothetical protein n=1 Tax=Sphaerotilus sp. TaxID=2093942 RepID=UPI0034E23F97
MWSRIKSGVAAGWTVVVSCAWLVPLAMAGSRVLAYLNDDLARLQFKAATTAVPSLIDINESPNITAARILLMVSVLLLAVAIAVWGLRAHRSFRAASDRLDGSRTRLKDRERALEQQLQYLESHVTRAREALSAHYERLVDTAAPDTVASVFDARFERLESLLARHLGEMDRRLGTVEGELRTNGEHLAHQFVDLRDRVVQVQSVNSSNFGDLASAPVPLGGMVGPGARLQDLVLNLSHLQEDLRLERRQLRKKLAGLPDAGRSAAS